MIGVVIAWQAAVQALLFVARDSNPPIAIRMGDETTKLKLQVQLGLSDPKELRDTEIVNDARKALRRNPLDAVALRALALHYDALKNPKKAVQFAQLGGEATRRDRPIQLLLAGAAAQAGDADRTMEHLNTALSTTASGRQQIFAAMSQMTRQQIFLDMLQPYVRDDVLWMPGFLGHLVSDGAEGPRAAAQLVLRADPKNTADIQKKIGGDLLGMLATYGEYDLLRRTYDRTRGTGKDLSQLATFDAATANKDLGWLGWTPSTNASLGADLDVGENGRMTATVYAGQSERGVALHRTLFLKPGRYTLNETRQLAIAADRASAQWNLYCPDDKNGRRLIWSGPKQLAYTVRSAPGPLIPADCKAQVLELQVYGGDSTRGFEIVIDQFALTRAN
ncbi:hypothetical protein ASD76_03815 [Altererythrobacter sp. Root672]|nr:hypothetical protein ASD76_03815 [Altererythrobacter sp. Root672]